MTNRKIEKGMASTLPPDLQFALGWDIVVRLEAANCTCRMGKELELFEEPGMGDRDPVSRRGALEMLAWGAGAVAFLSTSSASAAVALPEIPEWMRRVLIERLGRRNFQEGRIELDLPDRADTGLSVPLTASVPDSPMSDADHVRSLHILTTGNPQPLVTDYYFTPRSGIARVSQRIRLARSQFVFGFSFMSDGSAWMSAKYVTVSLGACAVEIFMPDAKRSSRKN
ncbi:MAG: hypothetical protein OXI87_17680 [Albidovulum sp.]|nr:hypothetical protein [Albidovulum sp.]MDE0532668.1 hypothetical protein [Albidovulum sp.]